MKKLFLAFLAIPLLFISCTSDPGPIGPPGSPGAPGEDGVNILGQIFEVQVDFNLENDFREFIDIPGAIEVFDTDVMLAYILNGVVDGLDIWEPLPQTLFLDDGILLYGFNFTSIDIELFLDGTVSFEGLDALFTDDVVFRIAVIPADQAEKFEIESLGMDQLLNSLNNKEIIKMH